MGISDEKRMSFQSNAPSPIVASGQRLFPSSLAKKAQTVREVAGVYKQVEIPCAMYMGLSMDGFIQYDDSGNGNPWGITRSRDEGCKTTGKLPDGFSRYPWVKVSWPSVSGPGPKQESVRILLSGWGSAGGLNWYDSRVPSHVRNAVNDAYRDTLSAQPPFAQPSDAECVVDFGSKMAGKVVRATAVDGLSEPIAVMSDSRGLAWFRLSRPGLYTFACDGEILQSSVSGRDAAANPGFQSIQRINQSTERP